MFQGRLLLASAYQKAKQWEGGLQICMDLYLKVYENDVTPPQTRQILMDISYCFNELGTYEKAIRIGQSAVEMNRYFPGVYRYIALSHKANGDLEAALNTRNRAVR